MPTKMTARQKDKLIEAAQNSIHFVVVGKGEFPTDMLRYDHCWPASQHDGTLLPSVMGQYVNTERRIELRGLTGPTPARWKSFGWRVVAINGERVA